MPETKIDPPFKQTFHCDHCVFWRRIKPGEEEGADGYQGECRFNPPVIVPQLSLAAQQEMNDSVSEEEIDLSVDDWMVNRGRFPRIDQDQWCGKWESGL